LSDGLGRLIRVDEIVRLNDDGTPSGSLNTWTTRYEYDLNDCLTRITDSQNNVKLMRYDGLKRKTWMNDPDAGISTNTYDDASNLIETIDAKGQRITYTHDGANRLLTEDFHDEVSTEFSYHRSPDVSYFYDDPAATVDLGDGTRSTARNTKGCLACVLDASGEEHTSFDPRGRIEWTVKRISDSTLVSYTTRYDYDSMDRVTRMVYPDNVRSLTSITPVACCIASSAARAAISSRQFHTSRPRSKATSTTATACAQLTATTSASA